MMIPFSGTALWCSGFDHLRRRLLPVDAAVPLQRAAGGWSVAVTSGAAMAPATFSASRLLDDLRRYGVTYMNYVGKPLAYVLATPERRDDHDNPLRVAFGNEAANATSPSSAGVSAAGVGRVRLHRRRGDHHRDGECPPGSVGRGFPGVAVYNPRR